MSSKKNQDFTPTSIGLIALKTREKMIVKNLKPRFHLGIHTSNTEAGNQSRTAFRRI
jgi:hypothetical protein